MATYADMRARIADELANDGSITSSQINYAIQDTIKQYERREWWFNSATSTFITAQNQEYYTSADWAPLTDALQIDGMTINFGGVQNPMMPVDYESINEVQTGYVIAVPRNFAYYKQSLRLYPIPNGAYTVTVSYGMRLSTLSADTDSNAWTNEAEELIRQGAKRKIALNYLQSEEVANRFAVLEREAFDALMAENRRRWPNKQLRVQTILVPTRFNIISG